VERDSITLTLSGEGEDEEEEMPEDPNSDVQYGDDDDMVGCL